MSCVLGALAFGCSDRGASGNNGGTGGSGPTGDTSSHTYLYDDPGILYSGRISSVAGKPPRFSAPAVTISARFKGVSAAMTIFDNSASANYFEAVIDGDFASAKKIRPADAGATELFSDLPYGEHELTVVKRTEASTGTVDFKSFTFGGEILEAPERPSRKIEIIGDSISAGSGNEAANGSAECNEDFGRPYSNASKSYGPLLARALHADYQLTAVSGIGAIRNYNCNDHDAMPQVYDRVFLENPTSVAWDHSAFVPDAIVMILGTNDFAPASCKRVALNETVDPENYALYISTMKDFLGVLRGYYPEAQIFLVSSPMLHDGWPDATYTSDTSHRAAITTVAEEMNALEAEGEKVHVLLADYSQTRLTGRGCGTHPSAYEHGIMAGLDANKPSDPVPASLMLDPIKAVMGW
jgi:hypothetical protein